MKQQEFIDKVKDIAISDWHNSGILPSVTIAQACLESGWGTSELATKANNLFGIKAKEDWKGNIHTVKTAEYDKYNRKFYINAAFRKYKNWEESIQDHGRFFKSTQWRAENYKNVVGETCYKKAAKALQNAGYATSQEYANQLITLIEKYKLDKYDNVKGVNNMRIFLSVGHSKLKGGGYTSASGYIHEYKYCKELAYYVKKEIEALGHTCDVVICPEGQFTKWTQEKSYKLPIANSGKYDLVGELHLNASNGQGNGVEVLYYPNDNKGRAIAARGSEALAKLGFKNRGAKSRGDLYIISQTNPTAVLFETFFCDNKHDTDLANKLGFEKIAKAICYGLVGDVKNGSSSNKQSIISESSKQVEGSCVMYYKEGNEITAKFIAQQLGDLPVFKDNNKDLPNDQHDKWDIVYIGDLGKERADTAKEACKKFLGWKI